jgi:hypothetical protein
MKSVGQSRRASLAEAAINILIGYWVAFLSQVVIFPLYDIHVSLRTNLAIGLWFTVISLVRAYGLRRLFNRIHLHHYLQEHIK